MAEHTAFADRMLQRIGRAVAGQQGMRLEFSLRLQPGTLVDRGRFCVWLPGAAGLVLSRLLQELDAPEPVAAAAAATGAINLGLGVAGTGGAAGLRFYRHDRTPTTLADRYRAWQWLDGEHRAQVRTYDFHYLPETADGRDPAHLVVPTLRPGFASLLAERQARLGSGFWLREDERGAVDQVDVALPWSPVIQDLPGVTLLARQLGVPTACLAPWTGLAIRHVASTGPNVTLYASAPLDGDWPRDELALQERVALVARQAHDDTRRFLSQVPCPAVRSPDHHGLDSFYGGDVATWRRVLGPGLHYHAGLFDGPDTDPSDVAMDAATVRAVRALYAHIPAGSRIYDIGCGWGGPAALLTAEHGCPTLGLTVSRTQFRHVAGLGLPVRLGDAEATLPPGRFDVALLLESLSHVRDKPRLLAILRRFAGRLVMRVNCQDGAPAGPAFGDTMHMISSGTLRTMLAEAGWQVRHWQDRRSEAWPSALAWRRRLRSLPPSGDHHIETLRTWCERVAANPQCWAANNPLIEVVAT